MARTLDPSGIIIPNEDGEEQISTVGVAELVRVGTGANVAIARKADTTYVDAEIAENRWYRGVLPSGSLDAVFSPGQYALSQENTYTGAPPSFGGSAAATLTVSRGSGSWGTQVVAVHGSAQYRATRTTTVTGTWGAAWEEEAEAARNAQMRHQLRVDEFKRRRGGVIGTSGQGVISFRFDHYYQDWVTKILPLMREHQIVGSMAMPGAAEGGTGIGSAPYGWADLEASHINDGLEIMCHSYSHDSKSGAGDLETEIAWSRDIWLAGRMPQVLIEGWMQPGAVYGEMGSTIGEAHDLWGTLPGRMLMANYAVVSGHRDGYYRQLAGNVDAGLAHYTIESDTTAANAKSIIDEAVAHRTGVVLMMHPNVIGTSGNMSTTVLGEVFGYVAQLRANGKAQNMTVGGMSLADASAGRREDLAVNGAFTGGLDGWTAGAGWTATNGRALSPDTTATLAQSDFISRRAVIAGSPRELVVTARSISGSGTLRVHVSDARGGTGLDVTRDLEFHEMFSTQRLFFTIPYSGSTLPQIDLTWALNRQSGARIEIDSIQVRSV